MATPGAFGKPTQPDTNVCGFWHTKRGRRMRRMMRRAIKDSQCLKLQTRALWGLSQRGKTAIHDS